MHLMYQMMVDRKYLHIDRTMFLCDLLLGGMISVHAVFETEIVSTLAEGCWNPSGGCIAPIPTMAVRHTIGPDESNEEFASGSAHGNHRSKGVRVAGLSILEIQQWLSNPC